jgi:hypothetical protein
MSVSEITWQDALSARDDLNQYGDNAIGLFALSLRFGLDDVHTTAAESITDGSDDKKCDIIFIDKEEKVAVVAQCYVSQKEKKIAPSNKASDLNTAVAWLLQRPISELPERIRSSASELRDAISAASINKFEIWYVHNLPESHNVQDELDTVEATAKSLVKALSSESKIFVTTREVGRESFEVLYRDTLSPILVNETIKIDIEAGFPIRGSEWEAYVCAVPAKVLHRLYAKHKTRLFSANVRDYLGSRKSDANINNGIKLTASESPGDFWVFNNGITVLTHSYSEVTVRSKKQLHIQGISIVNGAQTTGAIGSLPKSPDSTALVPARFVQTSNSDLIYSIIQFNNSQNKVTASDFRSTDKYQKRLRDEVDAIPNAKYEGGRRGGHADAISRNKNLLPSYTVGQALAAYNQDPLIAYNTKSDIWVSDKIYSKYFNEDANGLNIVFAYSLLRAVEASKQSVMAKSRAGDGALTSQEIDLLKYFRHRGATYLFVAAIASCLETFVGKKVSSPSRVSFGAKTSPKLAAQNWLELVNTVSPFCQQLSEALTDGLKSNDRAQKAISTFRTLVQATAGANSETYKKFARLIVILR